MVTGFGNYIITKHNYFITNSSSKYESLGERMTF